MGGQVVGRVYYDDDACADAVAVQAVDRRYESSEIHWKRIDDPLLVADVFDRAHVLRILRAMRASEATLAVLETQEHLTLSAAMRSFGRRYEVAAVPLVSRSERAMDLPLPVLPVVPPNESDDEED